MARQGWYGQPRRHALAAKGIKTTQQPTDNKWFNKAVQDKPPYNLNGWSKNQKSITRRKLALSSRPKNWTDEHRLRSAAQALQALANVTQDKETKKLAEADAKHFYNKLKQLNEGKTK